MENLLNLVIGYCDRIDNGRDQRVILDSILDESDELATEVMCKAQGSPENPEDGVFGEAVDILISTIDMIRSERKDVPLADLIAEIEAYAEKKCRKWEVKYGRPVLTPITEEGWGDVPQTGRGIPPEDREQP